VAPEAASLVSFARLNLMIYFDEPMRADLLVTSV